MGLPMTLHLFLRNRILRDCLCNVWQDAFAIKTYDHTGALLDLTPYEPEPHVALVDTQLPAPTVPQLIEELTELPTRVHVLVLLANDDPDVIAQCIAAGASGCLLEDVSLDELKSAIDRVVSGEHVCSPQLIGAMFRQLVELSRDSIMAERASEVNLTPRERQILQLISERMSNQEIADELSVSLYTVKNHVHNILEKLQVDDRFDAIEYARKRRLLPHHRTAALAMRR
jgi:two-component system nitrate/nitrite response regulator NarL